MAFKFETKLSKVSAILGTIATLASMTYGTVTWHFSTFVEKEELSKQNDELTKRITLNYLEIIIILKEQDLQQLEEKLNKNEQLSATEKRRYETLIASLTEFKKQRSALLGLPKGI